MKRSIENRVSIFQIQDTEKWVKLEKVSRGKKEKGDTLGGGGSRSLYFRKCTAWSGIDSGPVRIFGDISLYLLVFSPTLFASFPYQFASFSHQICFISPKKCFISPTKCCFSPTNCFIYPTIRCISPCNFVSLCQFTKTRFYQAFSIFRCDSIS